MRFGVPAFVVLLGLGCSGKPHGGAGDSHASVMPVASAPRAAAPVPSGRPLAVEPSAAHSPAIALSASGYGICELLENGHVRCAG